MKRLLAALLALALPPCAAIADPPPTVVAPIREAIFGKVPGGYEILGPAGPCYPDRAARHGVSGAGMIRCKLAAKLTDCAAEHPKDSNFMLASLRMAQLGLIAAQPRIVDGQPVASEWVLVLVPFQLKRGP